MKKEKKNADLISAVCLKRNNRNTREIGCFLLLYKILADEKKCKSDREITIFWRADSGSEMSLYGEKYKNGIFVIQNVEKYIEKRWVFRIINGKKSETFFCIILWVKICVKIIPKLEKNTTQVQNMCYNIVGKKQESVLCAKSKRPSSKLSLHFALTAWGKNRILAMRKKY